jgi:non-specific protein-tyrosine kinase
VSLDEKRTQLKTMETLQTANASVVREADSAAKIQPRPVRNGVLAFALGVMLALGLAFLRDALDTKVRTVEEMAHHLGMPLLGRIPEPRRPMRGLRLVMLRKPGSREAEAFRMLRTNLQFATLERDVRTIMITSSVEQEGKSTTVANLAVALAASGKRVILVDLDLRRPALSRLLQLEDGPGLTDVALGKADLDEALVHVHVSQPKKKKYSLKRNGNGNGDHEPRENGNGNGDHGRPQAFLEVLPAGPPPPDLGEFAGTQVLADIIWELRERADVVLVDAPPMLSVGDALALTNRMDAVLAVARLHRVRRPMLTELARLLDRAPSVKLGFVATGTGAESGYGYEDSVYYGPHARTHEHVA